MIQTSLGPTAPNRDAGPWAERLAVAILCAAAVVGPLVFGSTGPWPRFALETVMAVAAALWAVSGTRDPRSLVLPVLVAGLLLLQLVPLPDRMLMSLAPVSAGRWKVAHEGLQAGWGTISVEPAATAAAIRRLLLGLATVVAVTGLARTPRYRRWFYTALATSAALVWTAGIVFPVDPDNRSVMGIFSLRGPIEFWKTSEHGPLQTSGWSYLDWVTVGDSRYQADGANCGDGFGTYIYSNHFANALCLTLPALWAMLMLATRDRLPAAVRFAGLLGTMALACWTTGGLAQSRAGTAALAFGALVYLALIAQSRWLRVATGGLAAVILGGLLLFVATVEGPFAGMLQLLPAALSAKITPALADGRIIAAKIAGRMFLASPLLGTGLGSYGDLYPGLQRTDVFLYFAHNEYAQLLAECGLLGGGFLLAAAWLFTTRFARMCRERPPAKRLIDAGAWAAVAGTAAHAVFDWNMHAPANALLAAIVAGLALSSVVPRGREPRRGIPTGWAAAAFTVACLAAVPFLARDALADATLDDLRRATTAARVAGMKPDAPPPQPILEAAIAHGTRTANLRPGDWRLAVLLGQANLHLAHVSTDPDERARLERAAEEWFRAARRASAVTRGMPEPVPPGRS